MPDPTVLGQVALGYCAVVDRRRSVVATRLTVMPERGDAAVDAVALLQELYTVWPETAAGGLELPGAKAAPLLLINAAGEGVLHALLRAEAVPRYALEVPAFLAADPRIDEATAQFAGGGGLLALNGRVREPLGAGVLARYALQLDDAGGTPAQRGTALPWVRTGVAAPAAVDAAFTAGAVAAAGWPFGDAPTQPSGKSATAPELQVILELIDRVDREEPVERLEPLLKNDPTLAFRLLRYINSPGFGLSVEIGSFRHALMILGYQRLKRWLALLLASASKDANMRSVMHAAVRRGIFMEELVRSSGDAELRGEIFICGVFSLLDRLLKQPFGELLRSVPVPQRVQQALLGEEGPFLPYLSLVQAVESGVAIDIRETAGALMLGPAEVNRALLGALAAAAQLDR